MHATNTNVQTAVPQLPVRPLTNAPYHNSVLLLNSEVYCLHKSLTVWHEHTPLQPLSHTPANSQSLPVSFTDCPSTHQTLHWF